MHESWRIQGFSDSGLLNIFSPLYSPSEQRRIAGIKNSKKIKP